MSRCTDKSPASSIVEPMRCTNLASGNHRNELSSPKLPPAPPTVRGCSHVVSGAPQCRALGSRDSGDVEFPEGSKDSARLEQDCRSQSEHHSCVVPRSTRLAQGVPRFRAYASCCLPPAGSAVGSLPGSRCRRQPDIAPLARDIWFAENDGHTGRCHLPSHSTVYTRRGLARHPFRASWNVSKQPHHRITYLMQIFPSDLPLGSVLRLS
jgi:hypothetical protein